MGTVYLNGKYLPLEQAAIGPQDRGFQLGDGIFELVRAYSGHWFHLPEHLARLGRAAHFLRLVRQDFSEMAGVADRLLAENRMQGQNALFYLQITRGVAPRGLTFPGVDTPLTLYASVQKFQPDLHMREQGVRAVWVADGRGARCDHKTIERLANVLAHQEALDQGADQAIFVRNGLVSEGAHTNVFAQVGDTLITPAIGSGHLLPGITRQVLLDLCRSHAIPVQETELSVGMLHSASEIMLSATTMEIVPVVSLNGRPVGTGTPGPVVRRLQHLFQDITPKPR
ncbi:MAG: aminotransferase class IV [Magnetococcales bacterium]|nr:aminotransferase class IV [Magnetococcales bacterium]